LDLSADVDTRQQRPQHGRQVPPTWDFGLEEAPTTSAQSTLQSGENRRFEKTLLDELGVSSQASAAASTTSSLALSTTIRGLRESEEELHRQVLHLRETVYSCGEWVGVTPSVHAQLVQLHRFDVMLHGHMTNLETAFAATAVASCASVLPSR
jgi:hypothetical protein